MSRITRCPSCVTAFRVNDAQLSARGGHVRCGRCGATFDALAALTSESVARADAAERGLPATQPRTMPPLVFDFGAPQPAGNSRLWWAASAVALVGLALQAAFQYRTELGLLLPEAKPFIQQTCAKLGCEVSLPRRAELLSIESSDLQADGTSPNVMVLTATLRNRAGFAQAFPELELSLTSAQDRTVARRVLTAKDYAPRGTQTESGLAAGSELQTRVYIEAATLRPTGYRLYLFYY